MSNTGKARLAHEIIDDMADGYIPDHDDLETLRSFLPELPKQKTLEELRKEVYDVWIGAECNEWPEDAYGVLETWLWNLHKQLEGLARIASKPSQPSPKLPEGMLLATHPINGLCVVSPNTDYEGDRRIFYLSGNVLAGADSRWVPSDVLTFLDAETPHPEFLEGEADYRNAPEGTIVACEDSPPCHKFGSEWSSVDFWGMKDDKGMSRARRRVLRWGNE